MPRILIYTKSFFPNIGGLERNTLTIYNTLKNLGYYVSIFTETIEKSIEDYGIEIHRGRTHVINKILRDYDYLLINGGVALKPIFHSVVLGKPYILLYANATLYNQSQGTDLLSKLSNRFRKYIAEKALGNICLTKTSLKDLNLKNKHAFVLYNPIDHQLFNIVSSEEIQEKKIDCLFVGRIINGKGIFLLLDALELLDNEGLKINCEYVGDGKDVEQLKTRISKTSYVKYIGKLNGKKLIDKYRESKLLIVPSTTHIEGNPLVIAEAITNNIPVICSNQPSMIEVVGNSGTSFNSGDKYDLANKIKFFITDSHNYNKLKNQTFLDSEKFGLKNYKESWGVILNKLNIEVSK